MLSRFKSCCKLAVNVFNYYYLRMISVSDPHCFIFIFLIFFFADPDPGKNISADPGRDSDHRKMLRIFRKYR